MIVYCLVISNSPNVEFIFDPSSNIIISSKFRGSAIILVTCLRLERHGDRRTHQVRWIFIIKNISLTLVTIIMNNVILHIRKTTT